MIARLEERVQVRMLQQRKTPAAKKKQRHDGELKETLTNSWIPHCQEKLLARQDPPVP